MGLGVRHLDGLHAPPLGLHHVAACDLGHLGRGRPARLLAAAVPIDVQARVPLRPRLDVGPERAVGPDQPVDEAPDRLRAVHLELRHLRGAVVPAGQHQAREVQEVVVVQVREERVGDVHGASVPVWSRRWWLPGPWSSTMTSSPTRHHVAGAHALQRRCGIAGSEQRDLHRFILEFVQRKLRRDSGAGPGGWPPPSG